jgi:hypothetical protein
MQNIAIALDAIHEALVHLRYMAGHSPDGSAHWEVEAENLTYEIDRLDGAVSRLRALIEEAGFK